MIWIVNMVIAIVATIMLLASVWSFRASIKVVGAATWWFLISYTLIAFSVVLRGLYWDVFRVSLRKLNPEAAETFAHLTGNTNLNILFWLMIMGGAYSMLKCRHSMLPHEDKKKWPWWLVWAHPDGLRIVGISFTRRKQND